MERSLEAASFSTQCDLLDMLENTADCDGSLSKTCQDSTPATPGETLPKWLARWLGADLTYHETDGEAPVVLPGRGGWSNGAAWMRNTSDWLSDGSACSLSQILDNGPIDRRFFLSAKACAGTISSRTTGGGGLGTDFDLDGGLDQAAVSHTLSARRGAACAHAADLETYVSGTLNANGKAAGSATQQDAESGLLLPVAYGGNRQTGPLDVATAVNACHTASGRQDFETETFITHALTGNGFDASEDGTGRGTPLVPVAFDTTQVTSKANRSNPKAGDPCHPLVSGGHAPAIAFPSRMSGTQCAATEDLAPSMGSTNPTAIAFDTYNQTVTGEQTQTLCSRGDSPGGNAHLVPAVSVALRGREGGATAEVGDNVSTAQRGAGGGGDKAHVLLQTVRRLTPEECEKLQGFLPGYTAIPHRGKIAADGPRYKALGNSMAVPVMAAIGRRIQMMEDIIKGKE